MAENAASYGFGSNFNCGRFACITNWWAACWRHPCQFVDLHANHITYQLQGQLTSNFNLLSGHSTILVYCLRYTYIRIGGLLVSNLKVKRPNSSAGVKILVGRSQNYKHFDNALKNAWDMANWNFMTSDLWPHSLGQGRGRPQAPIRHCWSSPPRAIASPQISFQTPWAESITHIHVRALWKRYFSVPRKNCKSLKETRKVHKLWD